MNFMILCFVAIFSLNSCKKISSVMCHFKTKENCANWMSPCQLYTVECIKSKKKACKKRIFIHLININKSNRFICLRAINIAFLFVKETSRVTKLKATYKPFPTTLTFIFHWLELNSF